MAIATVTATAGTFTAFAGTDAVEVEARFIVFYRTQSAESAQLMNVRPFFIGGNVFTNRIFSPRSPS